MAGVDAQAVKDRALRTLRSFAPAQLATIGVLCVVAVVGALFFLRWVNTPTYQVLLAGLSPKDASAVTAHCTQRPSTSAENATTRSRAQYSGGSGGKAICICPPVIVVIAP